MKKILWLALFIPAFALLAGTVYGEGTGSTDGSAPDDWGAPSSGEAGSPDPENLPSELPELRPAVMGDPDIMKTAVTLASDPDIRALASDPEVVSAASSLDLKTLMANQKFADVVNRQRSNDQEEP